MPCSTVVLVMTVFLHIWSLPLKVITLLLEVDVSKLYPMATLLMLHAAL
jgi:hypothetical protein